MATIIGNHSVPDNVALAYSCPYCDAKPRVWCHTKSKHWSLWFHPPKAKKLHRARAAMALDNNE